jgi:hypothetical protein
LRAGLRGMLEVVAGRNAHAAVTAGKCSQKLAAWWRLVS